MTKAHYIINYLLSVRKLKYTCNLIGVSYKYIYLIGKQKSEPSFNTIKKLSSIIPPSFWLDHADESFIDTFSKLFIQDKYTKLPKSISDNGSIT